MAKFDKCNLTGYIFYVFGMRTSCRFAMAVHVLALLSCKESRRGTSESLAASVKTNPVVIRRLLQSLQAAGLVETQKGAGAGSRLVRCPSEITLAEIYRALETEALFFLPLREASQECPVGERIKNVLIPIFASVGRAIESELGKTTLADICESLQNCPGATRISQPLASPPRPCRAPAKTAGRRPSAPFNLNER